MRREIELRHFHTRTDSGKEYVVVQYQEIITAATFDNPKNEIPGIQRLATPDGLQVEYIDSKTFKIAETNEIIRII